MESDNHAHGDPQEVTFLINLQEDLHVLRNSWKKKLQRKKIVKHFTEIIDSVLDITHTDPLEVFEKVMGNVAPILEVKPRRVGGATYQVPVEVSRARGQALAMQWIRTSSEGRPGKSMIQSLAAELMDAYNNTGASVKMREDVHKTAEANRAFAHFRW